jgi:hypothetical protein
VFPFELEDVSPVATAVGMAPAQDSSVQQALQMVTSAARKELARFGRYSIVSIKGVQVLPR